MKEVRIKLITFICFLCCIFVSSINAQILPTQSQVLKSLIKVNDYFMQKNRDVTMPAFVNKHIWASNIWTRSVYYEGLMELYKIYPQDSYYNYATDWADFHKWNLVSGATTRDADNQCCGQTYIDLYNICPDTPKKIQAVKSCFDMLVNTPQVNDWTWIDAIQMAMPVFAKLGKLTGNTTYYDKMWDMYRYTRDILGDAGMFNVKEGLWWRDSDFDSPYKESNGSNCYWSRGNGWVYAALVRVLNEIPVTEKHYSDYVKDFRIMSKAIKSCQRSDGFWNVSMHNPENYGGKEGTGTSLFIYGLAFGIRNNIIDRKEYLPILIKAWNAVSKECIRPDGSLGYMQGTGKQPSDSQPVSYDSKPDFEDYGTGCFLLGGSELYKLCE